MKKIFLSIILAVALNGADNAHIILELDKKIVQGIQNGNTYRYDKRKMLVSIDDVIENGNEKSTKEIKEKFDFTMIKVELADIHKQDDIVLIDDGNFVDIQKRTKAKIKVKDNSGKIKQIQ